MDTPSPPPTPSTTTTNTTPPLPHQLKTYTLTACSLSYTKPTTTTTSSTPSLLTSLTTLLFKPCTSPPPTYILRDVSLVAHPSQILAIVGPSGAGKSTLLDILAASTAPSSGSLLLNSLPFHPSSFRKLSAYVPQHDASLPLLTVHETFSFTARLLLPNTSHQPHTHHHNNHIVTSLLTDLNLLHLANVRLGCGLSGGERRRVSIGLSLLHDPAVLLLDEPTSGLDSGSALNVMQTIRSVCASRGRTVVLSIHQPSFKILSTIDSVLLLSKGRVVHHGTITSLEAYLICNGFTVPPQLNPLEYAMEILNQLVMINNKESISNTNITTTDLISRDRCGSDSRTRDRDNVTYKSTRVHEIVTLYNRFWKIIYRTRQLLLTNTIEALVVGLVLGTIYIHVGFDKQGIEKRFGFFAFTLTFLLSSTTETLPIFINERPILLRETSSGVYRLSSHLIANTLVFLPYLLVIALIYSLSVYFLVGLCLTWQAFAYFVLVIWVIVLMANSFVLLLSSIAPNYVAGTSLVTVFLGAFFLFSGYFISQDSMPKYWLFMHYFSMYKYALDSFLINEYSCLYSKCLVWFNEENKECMVTGADVLVKKGLDEKQRWTNVYILIGFFVFYRVLCLVVLIRRASRSKR
ncbi:hypothetical protein Sjap_021021 [Stephania japonica]|uniref:ABC transporter domain-containing protein n=1 Tax=Stephania japonica TaxID=461633 RepID=A0AAP0HZH7_9MAGN